MNIGGSGFGSPETYAGVLAFIPHDAQQQIKGRLVTGSHQPLAEQLGELIRTSSWSSCTISSITVHIKPGPGATCGWL